MKAGTMVSILLISDVNFSRRAPKQKDGLSNNNVAQSGSPGKPICSVLHLLNDRSHLFSGLLAEFP